jgi:hypothetical protein
MTANVVTATMEEALATPEREATLRRLHDWRQRVHALYDEITDMLTQPQFHPERFHELLE